MGIIILIASAVGIYTIIKKIASAIVPSFFQKPMANCGQLVQPVASQWATFDKPAFVRCGQKSPFTVKKAGRPRKARSFATI